MTLNNQNLMLLTKFALKAKHHIGVVKVSKMYNNELYAFDILTKATLTSEMELVDLTKKISYEFEIGINLIKAIEHYMNSITDINDTEDFLHVSKYLLSKLAIHLYGIKVSGASYRQAVEKLLLEVDINERTFSINLARKFYRYWRSANRLVAESDAVLSEELSDQKEVFIKLWENIDIAFFSDTENWPLTLYADSMREKNLSEKDILISSRIAKVITLELRNVQISTDDAYREAIDRAQQLFEREELKKLFLIVSREYYQYWLGAELNPEIEFT